MPPLVTDAKGSSAPLIINPAAGSAAACHERRVDIGRINGRPFINNVILGVYAEMLGDPGYRGDNPHRTRVAGIAELVYATGRELARRKTDRVRGRQIRGPVV
jgi:diacylglycerol kinase family enzyme